MPNNHAAIPPPDSHMIRRSISSGGWGTFLEQQNGVVNFWDLVDEVDRLRLLHLKALQTQDDYLRQRQRPIDAVHPQGDCVSGKTYEEQYEG